MDRGSPSTSAGRRPTTESHLWALMQRLRDEGRSDIWRAVVDAYPPAADLDGINNYFAAFAAARAAYDVDLFAPAFADFAALQGAFDAYDADFAAAFADARAALQAAFAAAAWARRAAYAAADADFAAVGKGERWSLPNGRTCSPNGKRGAGGVWRGRRGGERCAAA